MTNGVLHSFRCFSYAGIIRIRFQGPMRTRIVSAGFAQRPFSIVC